MAFDDLAKHMAARDGKKKKLGSVPVTAEEFVAEEAKAQRVRDRERGLVLGFILFAGGLGAFALFFLMRTDAGYEGFGRVGLLGAAAGGMAISGARHIIRALRGRGGEDPQLKLFTS